MTTNVSPRLSAGYVDMNRLTNSGNTTVSSPEPMRNERKRRKKVIKKREKEKRFFRMFFSLFSIFMIVLVSCVVYFLVNSPNTHIVVSENDMETAKSRKNRDIKESIADLPYIHVSSEVIKALSVNNPIVVLESTIITHGMPYPQNYNTAKEVEDIVRLNGAIPATIAVLNGVLHVGLTQHTLQELAQSSRAQKCGRRDLSMAISSKSTCGTTVSATMIIAHKIGLPIFVTGGTGGVHQGVEETWDVSADLTELGRTPVMVISAGVKSILDIPKTLERLETEEVTVLGYQTDDFPAFYTSESGMPVPHRVDSAREAAHLLHAHRTFGMDTGILLAVPVPKQFELGEVVMKRAVDLANKEAEMQGIRGKEVTPFLLKRVNELTHGKSLESNIALIKNNARVGAIIAAEYSSILKDGVKDIDDELFAKKAKEPKVVERKKDVYLEKKFDEYVPPEAGRKLDHEQVKVMTDYKVTVIGGAAVDIGSKKTTPYEDEMEKSQWASQTSEIGTTQVSIGGVARNVGEVLARLAVPPLVLTAVGDDPWGGLVLDNLRGLGIDPSHVNVLPAQPTATFHQFLAEDGDLLVGLADMSILEDSKNIDPSEFEDVILEKAHHVFFDANIPVETMRYLCDLSHENSHLILYHDPVSVEKARRVVDSGCLDVAKRLVIKPNELEVIAIAKYIYVLYHDSYRQEDVDGLIRTPEDAVDHILEDYPQIQILLSKGVGGVSRCSFTGIGNCVDYKVTKKLDGMDVKSTTGAGDSFMGAYIAARVLGMTENRAIRAGQSAATLTIQSDDPVSDKINSETIFSKAKYQSTRI